MEKLIFVENGTFEICERTNLGSIGRVKGTGIYRIELLEEIKKELTLEGNKIKVINN